MAKKAASEQELGDLHSKLTRQLDRALDDEEREVVAGKDKDGNDIMRTETIRPSAAMFAVAAKFLKDNSIFTDPDQSDAMQSFADKLAKRGKPTKQDLKDAMKEIGQSLIQ